MRPCPFCGKADDKPVVTEMPMGGYGDEPEIYQVRCEWCGARGPEESTKDKAIEAWEDRK